MKNFVQPGNTVTVPAPSGGVVSGDGVLVGSLFGIASGDAAESADVEIDTVGAFDIAKDASVVDVGDPIYWDATAGAATVTATSNTLIGVALASATTGDATARVRLNGAFGI